MNPEDETTPIEQALGEANAAMSRRTTQSRVVDAAWAARAAWHSLTVPQEGVCPIPDQYAAIIAQNAFAAAWNLSFHE